MQVKAKFKHREATYGESALCDLTAPTTSVWGRWVTCAGQLIENARMNAFPTRMEREQ
jgi:hypothetical protein